MSLPRWNSGEEGAISPAIDVIENDKTFTVTAEVPGMDAKDIQVSVAEGYLSIRGDKAQETKEQNENYCRCERSYGSFQRVVALPNTADTNKVDAQVSKGVLKITIAKSAEASAKERRIDVRQAA